MILLRFYGGPDQFSLPRVMQELMDKMPALTLVRCSPTSCQPVVSAIAAHHPVREVCVDSKQPAAFLPSHCLWYHLSAMIERSTSLRHLKISHASFMDSNGLPCRQSLAAGCRQLSLSLAANNSLQQLEIQHVVAPCNSTCLTRRVR
jgi:hypothetical protein